MSTTTTHPPASSAPHPSEQIHSGNMSTRVLRKGKARAAARTINYDEDGVDSDDELLIQPPRKKPTRASTRLMEPAISNKDSAASETGSASRPAAATPDEMDIDQEPTRPSTSHSASATPSEAAPSGSTSDLAGPSKSSGPKVRLRLSRSNKLPPTPVMDEDEEDEVEEEEEDEIDNEGEDSDAESESASASVSVPGTSKPSAPMTARQAALAGVSNGEARLLSLDEVDLGRKKAPAKTEEELADKRREAAKRRKQQLEQKTKEEKEGAVDRLLNKQAPRPRAKRNLSGVLSGTPTGYSTPVRSSLRTTEIIDPDTRSTSPDGDGSLNEDTIVRAPVLATSIRWISTSRGPDAGRPLVEEIGTPDPQDESSASTNPPSEAAERRNTTSVAQSSTVMDVDKSLDSSHPESSDTATGASPPLPNGIAHETPEVHLNSMPLPNGQKRPSQEGPKSLSFTLSIPSSILEQLLPMNPSDGLSADATSSTLPSDTNGVVVDQPPRTAPPAPMPLPRVPTNCAVDGCAAARKYRVILSGGEEKGACGLAHFRMLKGTAG